jgi:hypothetical protein
VPADTFTMVMSAVRGGFTDSIHDTFLAGTLVCLVAAAASWFLRNPVAERTAATERASERATVAAD